MPAVPKRQRSKKRQRTSRILKGLVAIPNLKKLGSGKHEPAGMVTPDNPMHKGVKFLRSPKKKSN